MSIREWKKGSGPLSASVFHVLLALANGPNHGLGIADDVEEATGSAVKLGPGTLYRALKQMVQGGLIAEAEAPSAEEDSRRRHYRLTPAGRESLEHEAERYRRVVVALAERDVLATERSE
jgi:DNA-binding PadR family transcriptional regulator